MEGRVKISVIGESLPSTKSYLLLPTTKFEALLKNFLKKQGKLLWNGAELEPQGSPQSMSMAVGEKYTLQFVASADAEARPIMAPSASDSDVVCFSSRDSTPAVAVASASHAAAAAPPQPALVPAPTQPQPDNSPRAKPSVPPASALDPPHPANDEAPPHRPAQMNSVVPPLASGGVAPRAVTPASVTTPHAPGSKGTATAPNPSPPYRTADHSAAGPIVAPHHSPNSSHRHPTQRPAVARRSLRGENTLLDKVPVLTPMPDVTTVEFSRMPRPQVQRSYGLFEGSKRAGAATEEEESSPGIPNTSLTHATSPLRWGSKHNTHSDVSTPLNYAAAAATRHHHGSAASQHASKSGIVASPPHRPAAYLASAPDSDISAAHHQIIANERELEDLREEVTTLRSELAIERASRERLAEQLKQALKLMSAQAKSDGETRAHASEDLAELEHKRLMDSLRAQRSALRGASRSPG